MVAVDVSLLSGFGRVANFDKIMSIWNTLGGSTPGPAGPLPCLSQELKKVRHMSHQAEKGETLSHQAETLVSPNCKR